MPSFKHKYDLGQMVYSKRYSGTGTIIEVNVIKAFDEGITKPFFEIYYIVQVNTGGGGKIFELDENEITGIFTPTAGLKAGGITVNIKDARALDTVLLGETVDELLDALNIYTDLYKTFGDEEYAQKIVEVKKLLERSAKKEGA